MEKRTKVFDLPAPLRSKFGSCQQSTPATCVATKLQELNNEHQQCTVSVNFTGHSHLSCKLKTTTRQAAGINQKTTSNSRQTR
jgi:hypothetical protein